MDDGHTDDDLDKVIADGLLVPVFNHRFYEPLHDKPLLMCRTIAASLDHVALQHVWDLYLAWRKMQQEPDDAQQMFYLPVNGRMVCVLEHVEYVTILYGEDLGLG